MPVVKRTKYICPISIIQDRVIFIQDRLALADVGKFLYHNIVLLLACSQVTGYKNWLSGTARIYTTDLAKSVTTFRYYD